MIRKINKVENGYIVSSVFSKKKFTSLEGAFEELLRVFENRNKNSIGGHFGFVEIYRELRDLKDVYPIYPRIDYL
jgi:hypothetical protein